MENKGLWLCKSDNEEIMSAYTSIFSAFVSLYEREPNSKSYSFKLIGNKGEADKSFGCFKVEGLEVYHHFYEVEFITGLILEVEAFSIKDAIKEANKLHSDEIIKVKFLRTEVEK